MFFCFEKKPVLCPVILVFLVTFNYLIFSGWQNESGRLQSKGTDKAL